MARDDRTDPNRRPPPNPRDLRASLSSNLGLARGRAGGGEDPVGRLEPTPPHDLAEPSLEPPIADWDPPPADPDPIAGEAPPPPEAPARPRLPKSRAKPTRRAASEAGGRDVVPPQAIAGRALVLVVAIMGFLACLAVGALALVAEAAHDWQLDVSREVTIQVKPIDGTAIEPRLQRAMEIARATAGVRSTRLVDAEEGAALLEPWLGQGLDLSALPIPRLVVVDLADPAAADLAGLKSRIAADVRGAAVDDHAIWASRLRTMARAMVAVGFVVVVLMLVAMVVSVIFATRAAMAGNRDVIEVLHFVGAEDRFIAAEFQRHFLTLGLVGGIAGGVAAMIAFLALDLLTRTRGDALSDQAQALFGGFSIGWTGHLGALAVVGLVALLTAVTSRLTVLAHLGRIE